MVPPTEPRLRGEPRPGRPGGFPLVLGTLGLAATGAVVALAPGPGPAPPFGGAEVTMALVRTTSGPAQDRISFTAPLMLHSTRQPEIARPLRLIRRLPRPELSVACPADFGVEYRLTLTGAAGRLLAFRLGPGGCGLLAQLAGGPIRRVVAGDGFWTALAAAVGHPRWGYSAFAGALIP